MSNSFDPDQAQRFVVPVPDLGQICLQRLWADSTRRQRVILGPLDKSVKVKINFLIINYNMWVLKRMVSMRGLFWACLNCNKVKKIQSIYALYFNPFLDQWNFQ